MATSLDKNTDSLGDEKKDASAQQDSESTLMNSLVERKFDPFLLQAIFIRLDLKKKTSHMLHRRRVEKLYRCLCSRYSDDKGDEQKAPGSAAPVEKSTEHSDYSDDESEKIKLLAKHMSLIRGSMVLKNRRSTVIENRLSTRKSAERVTNILAMQMARHRWQVAIGLVMGVAKMASHGIQDKKETFAIGDLTFDPSLFKTKNVFVLAAHSKFVLTQIPEQRTKEQVEGVVRNLRLMGIKSFNEYPTSIQLKIVQIARYEDLTPLRVITRQGRPAEHFFFIIDGTVVAIERIRSDQGEDSEELIFLRKGAMFGETEMVNRLNRRATVISKGYVELLTIERNDLVRIFENRRRMDKPPEHIQFLKGCDFTEHWPIEKLIDDLYHCTPYFFKQNVLIVSDSMKHDFLVVIRSGQCRVIHKLYIRKILKQKPEPDLKTKLRALSDRLLKKNFYTFSRHGSQMDYVFGVDHFEQKLRASAGIDQMMDQRRPHPPNQSNIQRLGKKWKSRLQSRVGHRLWRHDPSEMKKNISPDNNLKDLHTIDEQTETETKPINNESAPKTRLERALLLPTTREYLVKEKEKDKDNTMVPIYVQIDILHQKEVFGLDTLVFDRFYDKPGGTGLLLLSGEDAKGVDVVLLSKSYFIEHASEEVQWRVRQMMKSYPSSETLKKEIERHELWANYKQGAVETVIDEKQLFKKNLPWKKGPN